MGVLASAAALLLTVTAGITHADWPVVRGDAAATGVADSKIADNLDVLWKVKVADAAFEATAVVADGVVYLGDDAGALHAIKLADGEPVWKKPFTENGFTTAAAVGGDGLFTIDFDGVVRRHKRADGSEVWRHATESEAYNGPNLHGGALLVTTEAGELLSLDAKTGGENWRFAIDGPLRCSPSRVVSKSGAAHALLAGCDARLTAVDLATGKEVGAVDIGGQTGSTAALVDGRAYFGAESGEFLAVDTTDLKKPTIAWRYRDPRRGQGIRTAAAVSSKGIVYGSQGKALYALNPQSGERLWKKPFKGGVDSSPVIARSSSDGGERVIVATSRGRLLLLDLADGDAVWEYEAGGSFIASPAVADGRIVIGNTDGTLYCFGRKE